MIDLSVVDHLTGGRLGTFDAPCPLCGRLQRSTRSQRKRVLRIWRVELGFAGFCCARCGEKGHARDRNGPALDPVKLDRARAQATERERVITAKRLSTARWLWRRRCPLDASIGETYLRSARGYCGPLPATLGYLPPWRDHPPAIIAAFGIATEIDMVGHEARWRAELGLPLPAPDWDWGDALAVTGAQPLTQHSTLSIADDAVLGVHLIKLRPDGSDRLRDIDDAKITIGRGFTAPIVLAPPNDLLALTIAEGPEDALTAYDLTGGGAWAAGSAGRLPGLATLVPSYIDCVTVLVDANKAGRGNSQALASALRRRGFEVRLTPAPEATR
jgi:hypothetical protein